MENKNKKKLLSNWNFFVWNWEKSTSTAWVASLSDQPYHGAGAGNQYPCTYTALRGHSKGNNIANLPCYSPAGGSGGGGGGGGGGDAND